MTASTDNRFDGLAGADLYREYANVSRELAADRPNAEAELQQYADQWERMADRADAEGRAR